MRMDSRDNEAKFNSQAIQSYANAIQTMINNQNVGVKIADLGNACYDVSIDHQHSLQKHATNTVAGSVMCSFPVSSFHRGHSDKAISFH